MFVQEMKTFADHTETFLNKLAGYLAGGIPFVAKRDASPAIGSRIVQREEQTNITVTHVQERVPVSILHLRDALNASCYLDLIAKAKEIYQTGIRHIILDMSDITSVSISSTLALHSIALVLRGEEPLDPQGGWATLQAVADDLKAAGLQAQFKLLNPQPKVKQSLEQAGFKGFLEFHATLETAIASFENGLGGRGT